jgi:hypothetical protein
VERDDLETTANVSYSMGGVFNIRGSYKSECSRPVDNCKEHGGQQFVERNHYNDEGNVGKSANARA